MESTLGKMEEEEIGEGEGIQQTGIGGAAPELGVVVGGGEGPLILSPR